MIETSRQERAVSEVIGFVLLFATVIILLSFWQAFVIPAETESTESNHQIQLENDLRELRDAIEQSRQSGTNQEVGVQLGPQYTDRILFANPPPQAGSIRTVAENSNISITNVTVADGEPTGTAAFWRNSKTLNTSLLAYDVNYNELGYDPSYRLENSFLYGRFDGQLLGLTEPKWIDGSVIRLTAFSGVLSENHDREQRIRVTSNSPASRSVTVESDSGPVTLQFPTFLSQSEWQEYLSRSQARHIERLNVSSGPEYNTATIVLNSSQKYDIELASVGIGTGGESTTPAYLASPTGNKTVYAGGTTQISAEIRDEFDNVLTGENVTFEAAFGDIETGDSAANSQTVATGTGEVASVTYVAPGQGVSPDGTDTVTISHPDSSVENIALTIDIRDTGSTAQSDVQWLRDSLQTTVGEQTTIIAEDTRSFDSAPVSFDVQNKSIFRVDAASRRFQDGNAELTITPQQGGSDIYAYVSSLGSGDRLPIDILYSDWVWETVADWAEGRNERTVTDDVGDREADTVRLGYRPRTNGLVGYWPFDEESSNTVIDSSGFRNNGTQRNDPVVSQDGILNSSAYQFDGSSSHVTVPHDESLEMSDTDAVSVSMWVNQNENLGRQWTALLQKSDTSYNLQLNSDNEPEFTIDADGSWQSAVSGVPLEQDRWYHLVGTYDGSQVRIYVNGTLEDTSTVSGQMTDASNFDIGIGENLDETGRHFDGRMDEIRLYDRSITGAEVQSLFQTIQDGTHTAGWKTGPRQLNSSQLTLNATDFDLNGGRITVTVESRVNGVIETSDPIQLQSGIEKYAVTDISTDSDEFRLRIEFETDDVTETPIVSRLALVDGRTDKRPPKLSIDSVSIDDTYNTQGFHVPVTVSEQNSSQTEDFALTLDIENQSGDVVYSDRINASDTNELLGESETVTFGQQYGTEPLRRFEPGTYTATVTATAANAATASSQTAFTVSQTRINFQPPQAERTGETPGGYLADEGDQFGLRASGLRYGWIGEDNAEYRERETDSDQRRDTLIHMDQQTVEGGVNWELDVANGRYDIRLVMGDPSYTDQNNTVRAEGSVLVDEDGNGGSNFDVYETTVEVTDGTFSIVPIDTTDGGGGSSELGNQKLNYITFAKPSGQTESLQLEIANETGPVTLAEGQTAEYTVARIDSNGTEVDVTNEAAVESSNQNFVTVDESENTVTGEQAGGQAAVEATVGGLSDSVDTSVADPAVFSVSIDDTNEPITEGDRLIVNATVENTGGVERTKSVELLDTNDQLIESQEVTLDGGNSQQLTLSWNTEDGDAIEDDITVRTEDTEAQETVLIRRQANFVVEFENTNSPVTAGNSLDVAVGIENTGQVADTQSVELENFDGTVVDNRSVTLDGGETTTIDLTWNTEMGDSGTDDIVVRSEDENISTQIMINEPALFNVTIDNYDAEVTEGNTVTVDYTIRNTGELEETQDIQFDVNGTNEGTQFDINLDSGETYSGSFSYTTADGDAPAVEIQISSDDNRSQRIVTVNEPAFFNVAIDSTNSPVTEGDTVTVDYTIENTGSKSGTQDIQFLVDGTPEATESGVSLNAGGTFSGSFSYTTQNGDAPQITAEIRSDDDNDTRSVTVNSVSGPPSFSILTADDSGVNKGRSTVVFDWEVSGTFDTVTLNTEADTAVDRTIRSGSATLDTSPGGTSITATVTGPGGTEECTATIGNGDSFTKGDFTCTVSSP